MGEQTKLGIGWKIFAALMVALFVGGLTSGRDKPVAYPWLDWISVTVDFLALVGLVTYAYLWPAGHSPFWPKYALIYPVWVLFQIAIMFIRKPAMQQEGMRTVAYVGAIAVLLMFAVPNWIAMRRLGEAKTRS